VVLFLISAGLAAAPRSRTRPAEIARRSAADGFARVHEIGVGRCSMCHAAEPVWPGLYWAPKGVMLETEAQVTRHARDIYLQSGVSHAMPPANITGLPQADRDAIVAWYRGAK